MQKCQNKMTFAVANTGVIEKSVTAALTSGFKNTEKRILKQIV